MLHREPVEGGLDLGGREAGRGELGDPAGQRLHQRQRITGSLPVAEHPHPLPVFGDVDQVEEHAQGPGHDRRLAVVKAGDPGIERGLGRLLAGPPGPGQPADFLGQRQGLGPFELADHVGEHALQEAHIAAEQFVIDHGSRSSGRQAGAGRGAGAGSSCRER
jgi:hypothetical protein